MFNLDSFPTADVVSYSMRFSGLGLGSKEIVARMRMAKKEDGVIVEIAIRSKDTQLREWVMSAME